jgi:hypothetical protein
MKLRSWHRACRAMWVASDWVASAAQDDPGQFKYLQNRRSFALNHIEKNSKSMQNLWPRNTTIVVLTGAGV